MKNIAYIKCLSFEMDQYEYYNKCTGEMRILPLKEATEIARQLIPTYKVTMPMLIHSDLKKEGFLDEKGNYIDNK